MTRQEHLEWCKKRALEYIDRGDVAGVMTDKQLTQLADQWRPSGKPKPAAMDPATLKRMLDRLTVPARRHYCPSCKTVFECHLCTIECSHDLHTEHSDMPLICEDCYVKNEGGLTIFTHSRTPERPLMTEYDYITGNATAYPYIRGWTSEGRSNGRWPFRDKMKTGDRGWVGMNWSGRARLGEDGRYRKKGEKK